MTVQIIHAKCCVMGNLEVSCMVQGGSEIQVHHMLLVIKLKQGIIMRFNLPEAHTDLFGSWR